MNKGIIQLIIGVILFIILGWIFTDIYAYFAIAIVLTAILKPISRVIANLTIFGFRIHRVFSVFLSFLALSGIVFLFVLLFVPLIADQINVISELNYQDISGRLGRPLNSIEQFLISNELTSKGEGFIMEELSQQFQMVISQIDIGNLINNVISFTGSFFIGLIAVLFITFFLLYETGQIRRWFISQITNRYFEVTIAALNKIERLLSNYLLGLFLQMTAIFTIASIGLSLIGIKYALTIAMFAAIANIIPYLGPIFGASFGIIVAVTLNPSLITFQDYLIEMVKIISVFAVVQVTDNVLWQPLIFSKSVKAHPLEIFIIIFAGATLAGILGMIAAIPVYTIIRVTFVEFYLGSRQYRIFKLQKVNFK